jgi:glycosyltransferase involved in cell wall biosynthesis
MSISVVLPAFNEAPSIALLLNSIKHILPDCELIVVDDGSTDDTAFLAAAQGARVISHPYTIGNGAAVKSGIRAARGDTIILMDADGQHNPDDIPALLAAADSHDMVVGARAPSTQAGILRRIANGLYNILASYITQFNIKDLTSGYRIIKKDVVSRYLFLLPNSFSYPTTLTLSYLRSGRSIAYVPISARPRQGASKIKPLYDGLRFLVIILKIATLYAPLYVFMPVSAFFFATGLCYYLFTFITMHRFTNMSALLLISSVVIFMMGLISEQITQLRYDRMEEGG